MTKLSVLFPLQFDAPDDFAEFGRLVRDTGATRLWAGQSVVLDTEAAMVYLAGLGINIPVGTSVTLMAMRHPVDAALQARSLAILMRQPIVAGYGIGAPGFVRAMRGEPYSSPRTVAANYLSGVRRSLTDTPWPIEHSPIEIGLGVLRPVLAKVAGEHADAAITWMTPPAYVRDTLVPALESGAHARTERPRVVTVVPVAISRDGRDMDQVVDLATSSHSRLEHYADMLRRAGVTDLVRDQVVLTGSAEQIADSVTDYWKAGVDEVVLNAVGAAALDGMRAAQDELHEIISALA